MHTTTRYPAIRLVITLLLLSTWLYANAKNGSLTNNPTPVPSLQTAKLETAASDGDFRMVVMDVFRISGRGTVITGRIEAGTVVTGQSLCVSRQSGPDMEIKVEGIEKFRKILERASAGDNVGLLIGDVPKAELSVRDVVLGEC